MELKTQKITVKGLTVENNIEKGILSTKNKDAKTVYNFCIIDVTGNIVTLKENNCIYQTRNDDNRIKDIIPILLNPPKKTRSGKKKPKKETPKKENVEVKE